jgi:hypothetical protein
MVTQTRNTEAFAHVRYDGRSVDVPLSAIGLTGASDDAQVRRFLAGYLEVPASRLEDHVIDRHANGNLTLRPQAVFG